MRTPEEIKKALEQCQKASCKFCPCGEDFSCGQSKNADALAYIQQLEDAVDNATQLVRSADELIKGNMARLESRISQLEMERDKVVKKLKAYEWYEGEK